MKITRLELKNFKRFDDLTIDMTSLAQPAKLVLLIGTNGSGKSSVFDALEAINKHSKHTTISRTELSYYKKDINKNYEIEFTNSLNKVYSLVSGNYDGVNLGNSFYGRTSIRQVPKLTRTSLGQSQFSFENDSDRPKSFIDRDNRFENDIEKVTSSILTDVFKGNSSTEEIKESYISPINKALENIFVLDETIGIKLVSIKPPLDGNISEILFKKGTSEIPYDYLSSGEKEIFNILLNLLVRKEYFQDTIYFLDEIDLHLNTQLQKNLLKEITENWIPDSCQLWTASHSLGFIEYANEAEHASIIDLDNLNFDLPQVIHPSPKKNFDIFEIAVSKEFLANLFQGKRIIFSENTDTPLYNNLSVENTIFFNAVDKLDVFYKTKNNPSYDGLADRDYLSDEERTEIMGLYPNFYLLHYYSIENYLFHPDNLDGYYKALNKAFNKESYKASIKAEGLAVRDKIILGLAGARGGYPFYKENAYAPKLKAFRANSEAVLAMFDSNDFDTFYKVFPAKDYGTEIKERQNLNPADLAQTQWFKAKIKEVLVK
ncbi:AAA family ATPase [Mucilaginibacter dorajii]|uniref:Endonuclease GajA/Old nuclease/RecF-like AAA domain-containing protein n=1 Tax=Mucilaginibacter dorajii TaxID=692994 RepID=A0ABP7PQ15_9SPHI|nr:AAA family ATPase [Mucilaginibacter dorajii]MCS3736972.1 AAA15 family ATPase/GTPase [Mucilaginibacter dorajii]